MEPSSTNPIARWLDTATAGIRFGPDRAAVRAELSAHLEDKALDLRRIFPDMLWTQAQERAASEMGDPEEIGKELARLHKPWLGWLWRASQVLLAILLAWLFFFGPHWGWIADVFDLLDDGPHAGSTQVLDTHIPFSCPETFSIGPYTFQVEGSLDFSDEISPEIGYFQVTWRAWSPLFWEEPASSEHWQAEDNLGNFYPSLSQWFDQGVVGTQPEQMVYTQSWNRCGLGWTGQSQIGYVPRDVQWIRLTLDTGEEPLVVVLEREEETP